mmetsp:Transcript_11685/g.25274  ORF Transcript_11685/g.25274 Transcript_11685/m.25274 type:complete len:88 (+) Transcript_11685:620-883(+)
MSRRLRPERRRHFSKSFEAFADHKLEDDDWASGRGDFVQFRRLEFDESFPFATQVEQAAECTMRHPIWSSWSRIGTHDMDGGAGHML